jgi:hypothetical protein
MRAERVSPWASAVASSCSRVSEDAIAFLEVHGPALAALRAAGGFEAAELNFRVWSRIPEQPMQSHFPAALVELAARCGVGLRLSVYLVAAVRSRVLSRYGP